MKKSKKSAAKMPKEMYSKSPAKKNSMPAKKSGCKKSKK